MRKCYRVLSLVTAFSLCMCLFAGFGAAGAEERTIHITAVIDPIYAPSFRDDPITDSTLNDIVEARILEKTGGVKVVVEWIVPNTEITRDEYLNTAIAAGTLPDVLAMNDLAADATSKALVDGKGVLRPITKEMIEQYMPEYTARISGYGGDLADLLAANAFNGKNLYVPNAFDPLCFPNVSSDIRTEGIYYGLYLRDDILTQVFPEARTEAQMKDLLREKGTLTVEDITGDLPIRNYEELYNYMLAVKNLDLKVGTKKVIPGAPFSFSSMPDSALWSLGSITGFKWSYPLLYRADMAKSEDPYATQEFKDYMKFLNDCFLAGLIDPEIFIMKDEQYNEKITNGEYAIICENSPVLADARATAAERGYGYRYLPVFAPMDMTAMNNSFFFVRKDARGPLLTTSLPEEDVPAVLAWIDFYMSEEYDRLRSWGSPDWYTVVDGVPVYKDEYKDIENWVLYGTKSEKDGEYYHMSPPEVMGQGQQQLVKGDPVMRPAAGTLRFFGWINTYPEGPQFKLKVDVSQLKDVDVNKVSHQLMDVAANAEMKRFTQDGWSIADLSAGPEQMAWQSVFWDYQTVIPEIAQLVIAPADQFEAAWTKYYQLMVDNGMERAVKESADFLADKWANNTDEVK